MKLYESRCRFKSPDVIAILLIAMCAISLSSSGFRCARSCRLPPGEPTCLVSRVSASVTVGCYPSLSVVDIEKQADPFSPHDCCNSRQVVSAASQYFSLHFSELIQMLDLAELLDTSLAWLEFSFDQIRGVTPVQALQEHRLNHLFMVLTDHPDQGLGRAIRVCGLGDTPGVKALFEQEFGIDIPLFLHISRRAADDRQFRLVNPEAEALVLPL